MVDTYALAVRHRDPERKLQFNRTGILLMLPRRHDGGAVTLGRVTAPPSSDSVQQAIGPLIRVRPWGR